MIEVLRLALKALNAGEHAHLIMNTDGIKDKVRQAIAGLESQEPVERNWREAPWGFGEKRLSTVEYSDIVSDGGLDPRNKFDIPPQRTWVGLTDEDCRGMSAGDRLVAMWADRTLKEKNT